MRAPTPANAPHNLQLPTPIENPPQPPTLFLRGRAPPSRSRSSPHTHTHSPKFLHTALHTRIPILPSVPTRLFSFPHLCLPRFGSSLLAGPGGRPGIRGLSHPPLSTPSPSRCAPVQHPHLPVRLPLGHELRRVAGSEARAGANGQARVPRPQLGLHWPHPGRSDPGNPGRRPARGRPGSAARTPPPPPPLALFGLRGRGAAGRAGSSLGAPLSGEAEVSPSPDRPGTELGSGL